MKPDPDYQQYLRQWSVLYDEKNYDRGLAAYFLRQSHSWAEREFGPERRFEQVLEVGAGSGEHIQHLRHDYDRYLLTDLNTEFLQRARDKLPPERADRVQIEVQDACALSYDDDQFDRLIAAHVLEHLPEPHRVLREWTRVLRPGGILTLVLPCDPGLAWRLGRYTGVRGKFKDSDFAYDYWMAREHINPINNLVSLVRYYFIDIQEQWRPLLVPSMDLNLFYIAHIRA